MTMSEPGALLAASIERVLSKEIRSAARDEDVAEMLVSLDRYLALPIPRQLRATALEVARFSGGKGGTYDENRFLHALNSLSQPISAQLKQEEAADQLADDPELLVEFLVESKSHLAL